ncbi:MAG: iron-sulfur cluster insertion protein ErpA [Hyphomicrobiales bacterium]|nr:MAG: iron-sulfur cluster insertion protein ErpA [Hyphomicrobiales bacterium]
MSETVELSDRAARRIAEILSGEGPQSMLRVSVSGGGCSGFQYHFDLDTTRNDDDLVIEKEGARVLIDEMSVGFLGGAEIDYVDDLIGAAFQVKNPNASASCGCGMSFSI